MYILYTNELELYIRIETLLLIAFTRRSINHRVNL